MHLNCVKRFVTGCQLDSNMFHCIFIQSIFLKRAINKSQKYINLDCDITHWITHTISDFSFLMQLLGKSNILNISTLVGKVIRKRKKYMVLLFWIYKSY